MPENPWSFVFVDTLSGVELATLPMTGVAYDTAHRGVGQLTGVIPTTDPKVRALDPWAATAPRRTSVFVEYDGTPVWAGILHSRDRDPNTYGLKIGAATYESWLASTYLRADADYRNAGLGAPGALGGLVATAQSYPNSNVRLTPVAARAGAQQVVGGQLYQATDVKTLADYFNGWVTRWGQPIEWRVDVTATSTGQYALNLLIHEGTFADGRDPWTLHYPGDLLSFTDAEDGTGQANVMVGAAAGATTGTVQTKLFSVATADQVGSDELGAGYPVRMAAYSVGGTGVQQTTLDDAVKRELLDRLVQGSTLSGLAVRPTRQAVVEQVVGDPVNLEITHPAYREWPDAAVFPGYRITGKKVVVGGGNRADQVSFDVVPAADRLPSSISMTAQFLDLLARVRRLEVATDGL